MAEAASPGPRASPTGARHGPAAAPGRPGAPCLARGDWLSRPPPPKMAPFTRLRASEPRGLRAGVGGRGSQDRGYQVLEWFSYRGERTWTPRSGNGVWGSTGSWVRGFSLVLWIHSQLENCPEDSQRQAGRPDPGTYPKVTSSVLFWNGLLETYLKRFLRNLKINL